MALLQLSGGAGTRVDIGDRLVAAAKTVDVKPIARVFARFKSAHAALKKHERDARDAEKQLRAAQGDLAAADLELDRAVEVLASALVGEGAPRLRPFTAVGESQSPSAIRKNEARRPGEALRGARQAPRAQPRAASEARGEGPARRGHQGPERPEARPRAGPPQRTP